MRGGSDVAVVGKFVVVAVKAAKELSRRALVWALTHVAQPGDCIKLLVVLPTQSSGSKKVWGFSKFTSDCTNGKSLSGTKLDQRDDISNSCSVMLSHLHDVYDPDKIKIRVKIVASSSCGVVATEAKKVQSNWVILDKHLKHERKYCMEELQCNVVVMKRSQPKVLRLNLIGSPTTQPEYLSWPLPTDIEASSKDFNRKFDQPDVLRGPYVTPVSSPDHESSATTTDIGASSMSSSDPGTSPFFLSGIYGSQKKEHLLFTDENQSLYESESESDAESDKQARSSTRLYFQPWMDDYTSSSGELTKGLLDGHQRSKNTALTITYKGLLENLSKLDLEPDIGVLNCRIDLNVSRSVREAISLSTHVPPGPPPLCSVCRHKSPAFGNPPKWFSYIELEHATDGFSGQNFLAEGGFGSVHRGVLSNGQVIAVKQHKLASSQGDREFCSEVEVLSCAQHRNVVTLIGFCVEDGRRLLVYEYICNGSLDLHLFGHNRDPLIWSARKKIAAGAARGLRYLHEECRVGCIVHRDMRPNNILITHDFEPLVGDFGLARWQPNGDMGVETRIIGTFGYLAPEYAQSGQITEKADVYSFGVVLLELVTGRKAIDLKRPKGQQCLTEWARPLLEKQAIHELVDPRLRNCYSEEEVHHMLQCASLCLRRDSHLRPRISQVLRMLEDDMV
ncbi:inactive protein kinase SELMODRAFT_444075 [Mercurialis annua]|uniref:inactive protein kinase SELMODRAFT_444075 n=1 Tax=Mercurialis annua TaxID=3986 RepID=UPI00215E8D49|nr:inactive protein kinase SELMODRAFT_444075 [Mercurialis annua]